MTAAWVRLNLITWVISISTVLVLSFLLILFVMKEKASQSHYVFLNLITIAIMVCVIVLLWKFRNQIGSEYEKEMLYFKTTSSCITNLSWRRLPLELYETTSFQTLHRWSLVFIGALGLMTLLSVGTFLNALSKIDLIEKKA